MTRRYLDGRIGGILEPVLTMEFIPETANLSPGIELWISSVEDLPDEIIIYVRRPKACELDITAAERR